MGLADSHGPASSETSPPPRWTVDGAEISLESLETGPLPDGNRPGDIKTLHDTIRFLARENRLLRERLETELKHRYGSRSEKRPGGKQNGTGGQTGSGSGSSPAPDPTSDSSASANSPEGAAGKPGHGRRPIPPGLEREEQEVPLDKESCKRCKGPIHRLERLESYRYHYRPGRIIVRVLVRWRCACDDPTCDAPFRIAKLPPEPIPKSRATAGFLAHLLVTKFADHCPIYRFRKILLRQEVDLPRSTLIDYCRKSTELLKPLWKLMRQRILESAIIKTDDTHVLVRLHRKKGVLKGHLWAYKGDTEHPYVVFDFTPNWEGKAPQEFLATFKGFIQADGYKGYDKLFEKNGDGAAVRFEVGCWAHARRKWVKAERSSPQLAGQALTLIGQLYAIEDDCKDLAPDQRAAQRQSRAAPVLDELYAWMEEQKSRALPKSPIAAAIEYAHNQKVALARYLQDGRLAIDNNEIEGELRAVALGRKNWMAAGSEVGGEIAAIGFTMIASAQACGVNPMDWLEDVLTRIVTCPSGRLEELLPDRWKAARDESERARKAASRAGPGTATGEPGVCADRARGDSRGAPGATVTTPPPASPSFVSTARAGAPARCSTECNDGEVPSHPIEAERDTERPGGQSGAGRHEHAADADGPDESSVPHAEGETRTPRAPT